MDKFNPSDADDFIQSLGMEEAAHVAMALMATMLSPVPTTIFGTNTILLTDAMKIMAVEGNSALGKRLIEIGVMSMSVLARLTQEARDEAGIVQDDGVQHLLDPVQILRDMADAFPGEDYIADVVDTVRPSINFVKDGEDANVNEEAKKDQITRLEDMFNLPDAEGHDH